MIKKIVIFLLALCAIACVLTKILIHGVLFRGLQSQKSVTYLPPEHETSLPLVFSGIEVNLPWTKITNVITVEQGVVFIAEGNRRLSVMRLPTQTEAEKFFGKLHVPLPDRNAENNIGDRVERFFVGDSAQLVNHPESIDGLYVPLPSRVTWRSNPFSDLRTAVGLIARMGLNGFPDMYEVENHDMRGYHTHWKRSGLDVEVYTLGMKNGSRNISFMMFNGSLEYSASVLGSLRVIPVPPDFPQAAFETSKKLAQTSGSDPAGQKLAVLTAIEAASNTSPNLTYFTHVLDLCRKFHFLAIGQSWFSASLHYFPASQSKLIARYPEFVKKRALQVRL